MNSSISQYLDHLSANVPVWVFAPVVFIFCLIILHLVKTLFFARILHFSKASLPVVRMILEAARFPTTLLILASSVYVLELLLPLELKAQRAAILLVQITVILSIILFFDRLMKEFSALYASKSKLTFISKGLLKAVIRGSVIGLGLLIFLDLIGISITPVLASLGIGSLAVALALQDTLTNFFAGVYITIDQPVREGDFVRLESGEEGYVREVSWRSTRIQILPDKLIVVPNHKLSSTIITNYYLPTPEFSVNIPVAVHHTSDLQKVEAVTLEVAKQIGKTAQGAVLSFDPIFRYISFAGSSINFNVTLRVSEIGHQHLMRHEFIKALHERYQKENILIAYPLQTLELSDAAVTLLKK